MQDEEFAPGFVVLIRTDLGAIFKIGNPELVSVPLGEGVQFDYADVTP